MSNVEINEGWEQRYQAVKDHVSIDLSPKAILGDLVFSGLITEAESERALWKILLIEPFVTRMVVNMIKGTIKYTTDDWSLETWREMALDDRVDGINYDALFHNHLRELREMR